MLDLELTKRLVELEPDSQWEAAEVLGALTSMGIAVRDTNWWRMRDAMRAWSLTELKRERPDSYQAAVKATLDALSNGSRSTFEAAFGSHGLRIVAAALRLGVAEQTHESKSFAELVNVVNDSIASGRTGDVLAAVRRLDELPSSDSRERQRYLLEGLLLWNVGDRDAAVRLFDRVRAASQRDVAHAIATHLVAVNEAAHGDYVRAVELATAAADLLRQLGDWRGLAMTLNTLGAIQRDLAGAPNSPVTIDDAIATLEEAVAIGSEVSAEQGRLAKQLLATALDRAERYDEAIFVAEEALDGSYGSARLAVLRLLGSLYTQTAHFEAARAALIRGAETASAMDDRRSRAHLLNVLANLERKTGSSGEALVHIRESVAIGEELRDQRHLSQAYLTLASVLLSLGNVEDIPAARAAADQSKLILESLRDRRGLAMVDATLERIRRRLT